ncbi:hypothetical protein D9M73_90600 [compost metagenome]
MVLQVLKHGHHIGRFVRIDHGPDGCINQLVFGTVEVLVHQQVAHAVPGAVVQQQATQHAGLALDGMRRNAQLRELVVVVWHVLSDRGVHLLT